MADVVQGPILDAVVSVFVKDVANVLYVHSQYVQEFQSQFDDMVQKLKLMKGYVTDAEKLKGDQQIVRETLNALRELIYDADDLFIECQIRADYRKMRESSFCSSLSLRDLFFRYQTGKKLTCINRRMLTMSQSLNTYRVSMGGQPNNESSHHAKLWTSQVFDDSQIVGLEKDVKTLKSWIIPQNERLHQVGIVGMGGLGKTTIAQKFFSDKQVSSRFGKRIWLSISQTFCEINIMKRILEKLQVIYTGSDEGDLLDKVRQALSHTTYLIVLDDVWNLENGWWGRISTCFPEITGQSSCIIITSRIENVIERMGVVETRIHRPQLLNDDESWLLFCKFAFKYNNGICTDEQLRKLGDKIVKNCHGLPLAIKTVGGLLSSKKQPSEWKKIFEKFDGKLALATNTAVVASLQLSYDDLPTHLKHCILCFSVYPEDYEINTEQLVRWWVGEGFVQETRSVTAVENGFSYLTELISRCLVEVVHKRRYDGRVHICKVHDLVRELTILIAKEEAFSSFSDAKAQIPTADSRRLGITSDAMNFQDLRRNSKLRAVLLMTNRPITFKKSNALAQVNSLRVLDLSQLKLDNVSQEEFWHWICSLKRLVYLNLRSVKGLCKIPNSIGKLWGLQTLILAECIELKTLPTSIVNLFRLKVLDVGNSSNLNCLPQGLRKLENLQELYGFKVPASTDIDACQLSELRDLTKLRILQIEIREGSIIKEEDRSVLKGHDSLRVLLINANSLDNKGILENIDQFSPPRKLEEVYLKRYNGQKIPQWMNPSSLPEVEYLCFEEFKYAATVNKEFWGDGKVTWKVEGLCMKHLTKLEMNWKDLKHVMPSLRFMEISNCYMLQDFPCEVKLFDFWPKPDIKSQEKDNMDAEVIDCQEEEEANMAAMDM